MAAPVLHHPPVPLQPPTCFSPPKVRAEFGDAATVLSLPGAALVMTYIFGKIAE